MMTMQTFHLIEWPIFKVNVKSHYMAHSVMVIFFQENMQCNLTSITLMKAISIMYGLYMQLKIFKKINPALTRAR